jgi:hypothetical protein
MATFKISTTSTDINIDQAFVLSLSMNGVITTQPATWGDITGTLSNQTDLQTALNLKADTSSLSTVATTGDYNDLSNKPIIPSITGLVPYTGATNNVNLGANTFTASNVSGNNTGDQDLSGLATTSALTAGLATKADTITAGTTGQYWRGDKTFQTLDKTAVGLGNVDNTTDLNKPISTATQTALNLKQNTITNSDSITQGSTNLFLTTAERTKLTNTSNTNTGDETNATITAKLGTSNNTNGGYPVLNSFGQVDALLLPRINVGWYTSGTDVTVGGIPGYTDPNLLLNIENIIGYTFKTTNSYFNMYYWQQGVGGNFDRRIKPHLDVNKNVNIFLEFFPVNGSSIATLADIKNGTRDGGLPGDVYGNNLTSLLDDIQAYFTANPDKIGKLECRLIPMHEFNLGDYPWAIAYNRSDRNDWDSSDVNGALGVNAKEDYLLAFARISGIIRAHSSYTNKLTKITPVSNVTWSPRYKLADYIPLRSQYDYYGINVYDRYQASIGPSFFSVNLSFILSKSGNQVYNQIVDFTDAPIILCETGSSSNTNKYSKVERYRRAFLDFLYDFPQIVEWNYFAPPSSNWGLTDDQLAELPPLFDKLQTRLTADERKKVLNVKSNVITTDLTNTANWLTAGDNVGAKTLTTTTTAASVGSDETDKSSTTVSLSMTTAGTNPLLNYLYIEIPASRVENNIPYVLSYQAYTDASESLGDVFIHAQVINSSDVFANLRGMFFQKLGRQEKTYNVGITKSWSDSTLRVIFAVGHNSLTSGNVYIIADSVKLEKGEVPTPVIKTAPTSFVSSLLPSQYHIFGGGANTSQVATANQALYTIIEVPQNCVATGLEWTNGAALSGNARVGLYRIATSSLNDRSNPLLNSILIASSNSVAQSGVSSPQVGDFTSNVALTPGRYFMALMFSNAVSTFNRHGGSAIHFNLSYTSNEGSFALPATAPSGTSATSGTPGLRLRLTSTYV